MAVYRVSITIADEKGQNSRHGFYINADNPDSDVGSIIAYMQAYITALEAIITGAVISASLTLGVPLPVGSRLTPLENSDVEEGREFFYRTQGGFIFKHRIPTFDESLIEEPLAVGFDNLPEEVANLTLFFTNPLDFPEEWPIDPTDARGDSITVFDRCEEDFKASRKL